MSNHNSTQDVQAEPPVEKGPSVRVYFSRGELRVELSDGHGAVDLPWLVWEELVSQASERYTSLQFRYPELFRQGEEGGVRQRKVPWWRARGLRIRR